MNLDLIELDREIIKIINSDAKGYAKSCARNAINHLEKSWIIKDIDPEMAVFRAITAEEEAATAIFIALKEKGYRNAKKLKFRNHTYKQALAPFFRAIAKFMADFANGSDFPFGKNYHLSIDTKGPTKNLKFSFELPNGIHASPIPPLNFSISIDGELYYFEKELTDVTTGKNREDIIKYVKEISNLRNQLIYSRPEGIPSIESGIDAHLRKRQKTVFTFLRVLCLIFPHKKKAIFVQQAIQAFLIMLGGIESSIDINRA
jgi:hypothetical protein